MTHLLALLDHVLWTGALFMFTMYFIYFDVAGEGGWFFIFRLLNSILFIFIEFYCSVSIFYQILPYYVCYYWIFIMWWLTVRTSFFSWSLCIFPYSRLSSYFFSVYLISSFFIFYPFFIFSLFFYSCLILFFCPISFFLFLCVSVDNNLARVSLFYSRTDGNTHFFVWNLKYLETLRC